MSINNIEVKNAEVVEMKIQVFTPDGVLIFNEPPYKNQLEADEKFEQWKSQFKFETYYRSIKYGQIPLSILKKYCTFRKLK